MKKLIILLTVLYFSLSAQNKDTIFPGLTGQQLLDSLEANYKPSYVLSYNDARDKMYAIIYNVNDSLEGVYTGYKIYVPYNASNPRDYTNAANPIMNCEHTWPQSKGASGNARSDMHHLYATNGDANSARGSYPFNEINDQTTDYWWINSIRTSSIPGSNIDLYSEENQDTEWEPREQHKGNVARAMFYFYTMYKAQANAADPNFFPLQKDVLWQWHKADPADALEISRTNQIATYQDNKPNPFILDATLVQRAYFPTAGISDEMAEKPDQFKLYQNYPNPFNPETKIDYYIPEAAEIILEIYNVLGQKIFSETKTNRSMGTYTFTWQGKDNADHIVSSGMYFYRVLYNSKNNFNVSGKIKKMVLIR